MILSKGLLLVGFSLSVVFLNAIAEPAANNREAVPVSAREHVGDNPSFVAPGWERAPKYSLTSFSVEEAFPSALFFKPARDQLFIADNTALFPQLFVVQKDVRTSVAGSVGPFVAAEADRLGPATSAHFQSLAGVWVDSNDNIFLSDSLNHRIRQVTPDGQVASFAGQGLAPTAGVTGDNGPATSSFLDFPQMICGDQHGNVFITEFGGHRIRKASQASGLITTVIGNGIAATTGDGGPATSASIDEPRAVFVNAHGDIFFTQTGTARVRMVKSADGIVVTLAGTGSNELQHMVSFSGGPALTSNIVSPKGIWGDLHGAIFFADEATHRVYKIAANYKAMFLIAGNSSSSSTHTQSTHLEHPYGLCGDDSTDRVFVSQYHSKKVTTLTPDNIYRPVSARTNTAAAVAADSQKELLEFHRVGGISSGGGSSGKSGGDKMAVLTTGTFVPPVFIRSMYPGATGLTLPGEMFFSIHNKILYIGDSLYNPVLKAISPSGVSTVIAGGGSDIYTYTPIPALTASLYSVGGVWQDSTGVIFIADTFDNRIKKVTTNNYIVNLAGDGYRPFDGLYYGPPGLLSEPYAIYGDKNGNLFVTTPQYHRILCVNTDTGDISVVAGTGVAGSSGEGELAVDAQIKEPYGIFVNAEGDIFFTESHYSNGFVKFISATYKTIHTLAGNSASSVAATTSGSSAVACKLINPTSIWVNKKGDIFVAESGRNQIVMLSKESNYQTIYLVSAGVSLASPRSLSGNDINGDLFVVDGVIDGPYSTLKLTDTTFVPTIRDYTKSVLPGGSALIAPAGVFFIPATQTLLLSEDKKFRSVQNGIITVIAGSGVAYNAATAGNAGPALDATFSRAYGIWQDSTGVIFISDSYGHRVRKLSGGQIVDFVGTGTASSTGVGQATSATVNYPALIYGDKNGNVFVPELFGHRIRKVTRTTGLISTVVGTGTAATGTFVEGTLATSAAISTPTGVFVNDRNDIYFTTYTWNRIMWVKSIDNKVYTLAGATALGPPLVTAAGGPAFTSNIQNAVGIWCDDDDNVFFTESNRGRVNMISKASDYQTMYLVNPGMPLNSPYGLSGDSATGRLFVAEFGGTTIALFSDVVDAIPPPAASYQLDYELQTYEGTASLNAPVGVHYVADTQTLLLSDRAGFRSVQNGVSTVIAGSAAAYNVAIAGNAGPATSASFQSHYGIWQDSTGVIFVSDSYGNRVRKISGGQISDFVGTGTGSSTGVGQATSATVNYPALIYGDKNGNLFVPELFGNLIRKVTRSTGLISTVVGTGTAGIAGSFVEGTLATLAAIGAPTGLFVNDKNDIYFTTYSWNRIMWVKDVDNKVYTLAGAGSSMIVSSGPAFSSSAQNAVGIWCDDDDNVYFTESSRGRVNMISKSSDYQTMYLVNPGMPLNLPYGLSGDSASGRLFAAPNSGSTVDVLVHGMESTSLATAPFQLDYQLQTYEGIASLDAPVGVHYVPETQTLLLSERAGFRSVKNGVSTLIIGSGAAYNAATAGNAGPATSANFHSPYAIWQDSTGVIFVSDSNGHRVRKVSGGQISNYVGTGTGSSTGVGQATSATVNYPALIHGDKNGNLFVPELFGNRIRKVTRTTGLISTLVGTGTAGTANTFVEGTLATSAAIVAPTGLFLNNKNDLFFTTYGWNRIMWVKDVDNKVYTLAGAGSSMIVSSGPAFSSSAQNAVGIWCDDDDNVYFTESNRGRVNMISKASDYQTMYFVNPGMPLNLPFGLSGDSVTGRLFAAPNSGSTINMLTNLIPSNTPHSHNVQIYPGAVGLSNPVGVFHDSASVSDKLIVAEMLSRKVTLVQNGVKTNIAGTGGTWSVAAGGVSGPATSAVFSQPYGTWGDSMGNVYVSDFGGHRVRKVTPAGQIVNFAGTGLPTGADITSATSAKISGPALIFGDTLGNVFIAENLGSKILKVNIASGITSTVAGIGFAGTTGDGGLAVVARINRPYGVFVNKAGDVFFTQCHVDSRVRWVSNIDKKVYTLAGGGLNIAANIVSFNGGLSVTSYLENLAGIWVDAKSDVYFAESTTGKVYTVTRQSSYKNMVAIASNLKYPTGVVVDDTNGEVFVSQSNVGTVSVLVPKAFVPSATIPQVTEVYPGADGLGLAVGLAFHGPSRLNKLIVATGGSTRKFIAVFDGVKVDFAGSVSIWSPATGGVNGVVAEAAFSQPYGVWSASTGDVFVSDFGGHRVRKVSPDGKISNFAGTGLTTGTTSTIAVNTPVQYPAMIFGDSVGNVFIAESFGHRVLKVNIASGIISTLAGTGIPGTTGDGGPAAVARVYYPFGVFVNKAGDVFFTQTYGDARVRVVTAIDNRINTLVGAKPIYLPSSPIDGAFSSIITIPVGIGGDSQGNIFFVEAVAGGRVLMLTKSSFYRKMVTIATTLEPTYGLLVDDENGDILLSRYTTAGGVNVIKNPAFVAPVPAPFTPTAPQYFAEVFSGAFDLNQPLNVHYHVDQPGKLTVAESGARRFKIIQYNDNEVLAGSGLNIPYDYTNAADRALFGVSGPATSAHFVKPYGVCADLSGNVFLSDVDGHRVRKVTSDGQISNFAGTGEITGISFKFSLYTGVVQATSSMFSGPMALVCHSDGYVYIGAKWCIMKVEKNSQQMTRIAGATSSNQPDLAIHSPSERVGGMYVNPAGDVYFLSNGGGHVCWISKADGILRVLWSAPMNTYLFSMWGADNEDIYVTSSPDYATSASALTLLTKSSNYQNAQLMYTSLSQSYGITGDSTTNRIFVTQGGDSTQGVVTTLSDLRATPAPTHTPTISPTRTPTFKPTQTLDLELRFVATTEFPNINFREVRLYYKGVKLNYLAQQFYSDFCESEMHGCDQSASGSYPCIDGNVNTQCYKSSGGSASSGPTYFLRFKTGTQLFDRFEMDFGNMLPNARPPIVVYNRRCTDNIHGGNICPINPNHQVLFSWPGGYGATAFAFNPFASVLPTALPTASPVPTISPSASPSTFKPTRFPTTTPLPSRFPTLVPSKGPTRQPTALPTSTRKYRIELIPEGNWYLKFAEVFYYIQGSSTRHFGSSYYFSIGPFNANTDWIKCRDSNFDTYCQGVNDSNFNMIISGEIPNAIYVYHSLGERYTLNVRDANQPGEPIIYTRTPAQTEDLGGWFIDMNFT